MPRDESVYLQHILDAITKVIEDLPILKIEVARILQALDGSPALDPQDTV